MLKIIILMHKLIFSLLLLSFVFSIVNACNVCYYNGVTYSCGSNIGVDPKFICCNGNWQQCDTPNYCKCHYLADEMPLLNIKQYKDTSYYIVGIDKQNSIIKNCSFPCDESNCSAVVLQAYRCPNVDWVVFDLLDAECSLFDKQTHSTTNYTVFAVDGDLEILVGSMQKIPNNFNSAVNYGCALLKMWPNSVFFGMFLDYDLLQNHKNHSVFKTQASCYSSCSEGHCGIDCPLGRVAYCYCQNHKYPKCECR